MRVRRKSQLTGKTHDMKIPDLTFTQYVDYVEGDALIQEALPHLTNDEREFILTGITPEEWAEEFGPADEDC